MKLMIFSGTTEGHDLCRFVEKQRAGGGFRCNRVWCSSNGADGGNHGSRGRLDEREMEKRLTSDTLLIDPQHPCAAAVTDNLRAACAQSGACYERLLRPALPIRTAKSCWTQPLRLTG
ncbi:MAG: precorrin-6A/cobalt-precorrin-6A reductase [Butyricicoccaceae bacterium]